MAFSLGDISPLAGLISGKGMFGDLATSARDKLGIRDAEQKRADELAAAEGAAKSKAAAPVTKAKGGAIASAVHKHERSLHKGQPLTKLAKGGNASKRADGCATKGKTKGRFV